MKKWFVFFVVLLAAAGFVFGPSLLAGNSGVSGPGAPGGAGPGAGAPPVSLPPSGGAPSGGTPSGGAVPAGFGGGGAPSSGAAPSNGAAPAGAPGAVPASVSTTAFSVRTGTAEIRSLEAYIELNGNIVSREQVAVMPDTGGKIVSMRAALGSTVRRGELIAEIDPSRPGTVYSLSPVYAPVSGTVISTPGAIGSTVSTATAILTIAAGGDVEIEVMVPEREVGQLRMGLGAEVRLEAFPGEIFQASITRLSPVVDPASRAKKAILRFVNDDGRIDAGMFARVKLNTRTYANVVTVNSGAVSGSNGTKTVYVVNSTADAGVPRVTLREVMTGVTVDGLVEIKSGVSAGETIVVQGQQFLSDGAAVRIIARQ